MEVDWKMPKIKGKVVAVSEKDDDRYGMRLDTKGFEETWFNDFGSCPVQKGMYVELDYVKKEGIGRVFYNVNSVKEVSEPVTTTPVHPTSITTSDNLPSYSMQKDALICRQVAFKGAIEVFNTIVNMKGDVDMEFDTCKMLIEQLTNDFENIILKIK